MDFQLMNRYQSISFRPIEYRWNCARFMNGPLFVEANLCRINEFTQEDAETMKKLAEEMAKPTLISEELSPNERDRTRLWIKQNSEEWSGQLYNGKVRVEIIAGWLMGDCSEYSEVLNLRGDRILIVALLNAISLTDRDRRAVRIQKDRV